MIDADTAAASWEPVASLVPFAGNPRKNERSIPVVADSIRRFGFGAPVVARAADRMVLAGHTRLAAAAVLAQRWEKATTRERQTWHPDAVRVATRLEVVVRLLEVDEHDARLYLIADNQIAAALSETDDEKLAVILRELQAADVELIEGTGLDAEDIRSLLEGAGAAPKGEDPGPGEVPEHPVSQLGEVYELGPHRLMCGDSTNLEHVRRLMAGERAALCATDPPYLVDYDGTNHPQSFQAQVNQKVNNKEWDAYKDPAASVDFFANFIAAALAEALVENPAFYQWHASKRQGLVEAAWQRNKLLLHQQIIWVKARPILTRSHFMWQHEPAFYGWVEGKPPARRPPLGGENTTVWTIDQQGESNGIHPTQKPLEIFERPIGYHTVTGDLVYEPFCGSGSQLIAAARLGRRCCAMELAPQFVDVIRRRWTGYARSAGIDAGPGALE